MSTITSVAPSQSSTVVLQDVLREAKAGDPLAPATVLVRNTTQAAYIRRALARGGGVAGVTLMTCKGFVQKQVERPLLDIRRSPASSLQIRASIQAELLAKPGSLVSVAGHTKTLQRLVGLAEAIRFLPADIKKKITAASNGTAQDCLRILHDAPTRLSSYILPDELLDVALEQTLLASPVIWFQPYPETPMEGRLLAAMWGHENTHVILASSGVSSIDQRYETLLSGWGVRTSNPASNRCKPAERVEVSDPEDEVQVALRRVLKLASEGVPLSSMAILYPRADPYASLCAQHLKAANLPYSGPSGETLSLSTCAVMVGRVLDLVSRGLDRSSVMRLLNSGPIVGPDGGLVPAADWDSISRRAGVVEEDSWQSRLAELASSSVNVNQGPVPLEQSAIAQLSGFIEKLGERVDLADELSSWADLSDWLVETMTWLVGDVSAWPGPEQAAYAGLRRTLEEIRDVDTLLPNPSIDQFRSIVVSELDTRVLPPAPYGRGILVTSVEAGAGLELEQVVVLGVADGSFPRTTKEDPIINDQLRAVAGNQLISSRSSENTDIWMIGLALAGSKRPGILLQSRSELRSGRTRRWPSTLEPLTDRTTVVASHYEGVARQGRPSTIDDFVLRKLVLHTAAGEPLGSHLQLTTDAVLARGLTRELARLTNTLNAHTGKVKPDVTPLSERSFSPTALETYARCPRRFLFERIFRVSEDERPERVDELSAQDKGSLFHRAVERFISEAIQHDQVPKPDEPWTEIQVGRLFEIGSEEMATYYERGLSGGRVQTRVSQRHLDTLLRNFVSNDAAFRATYRSTPVAVEYVFGFDDDVKVFNLPNNRNIRLRGAVDRIDTTADGGVIVIDYKTGSSRGYSKMDKDPLDGGRRLQLPIYSSVVAGDLDQGGGRRAMYWMAKESKQLPIDLTGDVDSEMRQTVDDLLSGIERGYFPAVPGDVVGYPKVTFENCMFCPYDLVCPQDRQREWSALNTEELSLREFVRGVSNDN